MLCDPHSDEQDYERTKPMNDAFRQVNEHKQRLKDFCIRICYKQSFTSQAAGTEMSASSVEEAVK